MVVITNGGMKLEIPYESFKQDYEPFGWKILEDKRIPKEEKVIAKDTKEEKDTKSKDKKK
ncbi:MAG TPA: hypothetical protein IAB40_06405 [Candidatus Onthocola stercoravium]|nr:hypothetical protein [Candidatus Onthocola stercoravium]